MKKPVGRHVSRLGISTSEDKVDVIRRMAFPNTLNTLESGTQVFNYYRKHVPRHSVIVEPLNRLKTLLFKTGPRKGTARKNCAARTSLSHMDIHCNLVEETNSQSLVTHHLRTML